ncbi:hypothetical protein RHMOL_Rhmol01G0057700 [Rhododendron molle]|uniref:Uncharacterized protein n=1 Tax=Rhododendron molle TaxID=49168 RepID=A0ACC0Q0B7_RHOML|nr:hypothetical protein RHMOL_Rhmol01G0057700 [Rhododendron molle]
MGKGRPTPSPSLLTSQSNRTEVPSEDGIRCGKWLLRSTCVRRRRGQPLSLKFEPSTPTSKRIRRASSPTPSANSFTGKNSVQVPMTSRKKLDADNWSYENTEIFLEIMVEEARKDHSTNSKLTCKFTSLQWAAILEELKKRTHKTDYTLIKIHQKFDRLKKDYRLFKDLTERSGLGWDPVSQTVTASAEVWVTYLQANKDARKFIGKGLDHYDLLHELLDGSLATGVFGQPSSLGAPSLEQEQALRNQGKAIKFSDSTFSDGRKRMSDGSGGPSSNGKQITMSTSEIPPYELEEDFSDDDDLLELETLEMMERDGKQKIPQRTCPLSGQEYTTFLLTSHPQNIKDMLRVDKHTFRALAVELVRRGLLEWDHKNLSVEESLAIFLYICGQNARERVVADRFQRSLDTISRHFNIIRRAICNLAPFIIRPPNLHETPPEILHDGRYYPWFKFTFVYPGWEGSAHDGRVFFAAVSNPDFNFPHPPINKYYLVDSGYTNMPGYLAPYRGQRYHRDQWDGANTIFRTPYELFNYKHSSLRNVIERCFGVLKKRFPILKGMPNYDNAHQPTIVTACCVIHNFILMHHGRDEYFDGYNEDVEWEGETDEEVDDDVGEVEPLNTSRVGLELLARKRDEMAIQMWDAY